VGVLGPKTGALGDLPQAIYWEDRRVKHLFYVSVAAFFGWKHWHEGEGELVMWAVLFGYTAARTVARLWPNHFAKIIEN
jgi:hypothetical protein